MKIQIFYFLAAITLISGCGGPEPKFSCVCESIPAGAVLEDREGTYLLNANGQDLEYWYKGIDTSVHPECMWSLQHKGCCNECCVYRNRTTGAPFIAVVSNRVLVIRKKATGRNLGVEPMQFVLSPGLAE